ncbi:MAG: PAS domain S-box protein [Candidatus Heimdallarchaeota archaeon]
MDTVKLLLVDDEETVLEASKKYLEKLNQNYKISTAINVDDAFTILQDEFFDAIISDFQMPEKDGLQFLEELRESGNDTPFIMLTGRGREEVVIQALNLGADYYLQKGTDVKSQFRELVNLIEKSIAKKRSDKELVLSRGRYELLAENVSDVIWTCDLALKLTYLSPSVKNILGYEYQELVGKHVTAVLASTSFASMQKLFDKLVTQEKIQDKDYYKSIKLDLELKHKDGSKINSEINVSFLRDETGIAFGLLGVIRDISERKAAEEALRLDREAFRVIAEAAVSKEEIPEICLDVLSNLVETLGFELGVLRLNNEDENTLDPIAVYGMSEEEERNLFPFDIDDEKYISSYIARSQEHIFASDALAHPKLKTFQARVKELKIKSLISYSLISSDNKLIGIIHLLSRTQREITNEDRGFFETIARFFTTVLEYRIAQNTLALSEERYRKLIDLSPFAIVMSDLSGNIIMANKQTAELYGVKDETEIIGMNSFDFFVKDQQQIARENALHAIEHGLLKNEEYTFLRKDGSTYPAEASVSLLTDAEGNPRAFIIIIQDISKRKDTEETLELQQQKLVKQRDELELFASTIAHDIRGKLQIITMYNSMSDTDFAHKIDYQIIEMTKFVENLLLLAKKGEILGEIKTLNLNKLVVEVAAEIASLAPEMEVLIKDLPSIQGDKIKLKQVFENLLINIIKHADATQVEIYSEKVKDFHSIIIKDNGRGMNREKQIEVKQALAKQSYASFGLLIAQKIVEAHGGKMKFESEEYKGTIFTIQLPK